MKKVYARFYCNAEDGDVIEYRSQHLDPSAIDYWMTAYFFTHPECESISCFFTVERSQLAPEVIE